MCDHRSAKKAIHIGNIIKFCRCVLLFQAPFPLGSIQLLLYYRLQICMREYGQGHQVQNEVVSQMIDTAIEIVSDAMP
jgi:hypothetical protein